MIATFTGIWDSCTARSTDLFPCFYVHVDIEQHTPIYSNCQTNICIMHFNSCTAC